MPVSSLRDTTYAQQEQNRRTGQGRPNCATKGNAAATSAAAYGPFACSGVSEELLDGLTYYFGTGVVVGVVIEQGEAQEKQHTAYSHN